MTQAPDQQPKEGIFAASSPDSLSDHINENIKSVAAMQRREVEATTPSQRGVQALGRFVGRPSFLVAIVLFIVVWILLNALAPGFGLLPFDPPPFLWLQGLLTILAVMTTTVVLIAQTQQTKMEERRAHLDLQVNLLTEQKVTNLIHVLEELRRDLPMVKDRHDAQATSLQERADAEQLLSALNQGGLTGDSQSAPAAPGASESP